MVVTSAPTFARAQCSDCRALMPLEVARAADRCPSCGACGITYGEWYPTPQPCPGESCVNPHDRPSYRFYLGTRDHTREVKRVFAFATTNVKPRAGRSVCDARCVHATSVECKCSCGGYAHGTRA